MGPVHWVIQENQGDSLGVHAIVQSLESDGHVAHLVSLSKDLSVPPIPGLPERGPLVCHGPGFVTRALNHPRLGPGLFFDPTTFRWSAFREGWKNAMLSSDGRVMPLSAAREFLRTGATAFIRPDADSKAFDGGVYDEAGLAAAIRGTTTSYEISVVVASPVNIEAEWRFFIVNREVVGCSEYRRWRLPSTEGSVPHIAIELAAEVAAVWSPAEIYCIDLAATSGRVGVVEANCFNASRFYAAVTHRVVRAVNAFVWARI